MPLVKLISSGLGLAFEANAARKAHKADKAARAAPGNLSAERGLDFTPIEDHDNLVHVSDDHAKKLIDDGHAVPMDSEKKYDPEKQPHFDEDALDPPPAYAAVDKMDEADWQLDEAHEMTRRSPSPESSLDQVPSGKEARQHYVDKIVQKFLSQNPVPSRFQAVGNLPCPVIIPQRRPHKKSRGFVQAYAPLLADSGISQDAFMQFHKAMYKASQASPIFDVINIAAAIAGLAPSLAAMITSAVVMAATKIAIETQTRQRTNSFLNQINDHFFRPRGLFCMIMKYNPNQDASHEKIDINSTIIQTITPSNSRTKTQMGKLRSANGKVYGELEMPQAAPLIFPNLDHVDDLDENGKPRKGIKKTGEFLANYYDKRAQAKYTVENQGTTLASAMPQQHKFASRFGDPNHPVNSGSLVSLISGGRIDSTKRQGGLGRDSGGGPIGLLGNLMSAGRNNSYPARPSPHHDPSIDYKQHSEYYQNDSTDGYVQMQENYPGKPSPAHTPYGASNPPAPYGGPYNDPSGPAPYGGQYHEHRHRGGSYYNPPAPYGGQYYEDRNRRGQRHEEGGPSPISTVKRMLQSDMLYLMIVNIPTEEEIQEARDVLAASHR